MCFSHITQAFEGFFVFDTAVIAIVKMHCLLVYTCFLIHTMIQYAVYIIHIVIKYFLGLNLHFNTNKDKGSNKRSADDCRVLRILWRRTTTMLTPSYIPLPLSHSSPYHHKMQTKKPVLAPNMVPNTNIQSSSEKTKLRNMRTVLSLMTFRLCFRLCAEIILKLSQEDNQINDPCKLCVGCTAIITMGYHHKLLVSDC